MKVILFWIVNVCLSAYTLVNAQPTRVINYTVDEGTWVSLDVSPDGQTIVFELVGDIYAMSITGGKAVPIATGLAFQSQPRFSPDGKSMVYISDESGSENVWIANADGTDAHNISNLARPFLLSPEWSPDGRMIYATVVDGQGIRSGGTTKGEAELWRFEVSTSKGTKFIANANGPASPLISSPAPGPYSAHISHDGHSLYYTSVRPRAYGVRLGAVSHIMRRNLTTDAEERLWLEGTNAMKPVTSPDGHWLVYAAENRGLAGLKCRDLTTGTEFWLKDKMQRSELEARASRDVLPNYDFTPDSKHIMAAFGGKIHKLTIATKEDIIIPFTADVSMTLPERIHFPQRISDAPVKARILQHLAISDDGRAALSTFGRIYLVDLATSRTKRLTNAQQPREFMPAWSPDGKWIVYASWSPQGGHLWRVSSKGESAPVQLTQTAGFWIDPVWSPDGTRVFALYAPLSTSRAIPGGPTGPEIMRPPDTEVVSISAQGGNHESIMRASNARHPHFVTANNRLFLSAAEGLISVKTDGTDRKTHLQLASNPSPFAIPSLRAFKAAGDGAAALVLTGGSLYKVALSTTEVTSFDSEDKNSLLSADSPRTFSWSPSGKSLAYIVGTQIYSASANSPASAKKTNITIELPRETTSSTVVLRGAKAITMKGDLIIPSSDLVVTNNRIAAIGKKGEVPVPKDATILDVSGKIIVPGFIDVHAHWTLRPELWEPECPSIYSNLAFGITTVRDPQSNPDIFGYADWMDTGEVPSPRIFSTGLGIFESSNIHSLDDARALIKPYRDQYKTSLMKFYLPGSRQQRQWLLTACREAGIMPTGEAGGDTKQVITHFLDGYTGNEHTLSVAPVYQDIAQLFARSGTTYTPTLLVSFGAGLPIYRVLAEERPYDNPKIKYFFPDGDVFLTSGKRGLWFPDEDMNYRDAGAGAYAVLKAGGRVALGGHGEMQGLSNHWEMKLMSDGGMPTLDILKAATLYGAETIGLSQDIGSLEAGKLADLLVLDNDPLEDIRNTTSIKYVMKNGRLYNGSSLDQLWPAKKQLPAPWWRK